MYRRTFLKSLGLGAGAAIFGGSLLPRTARAAAAERNFVFCYFNGGWDLLLSLDPRDPNSFTDEKIAETKIQTGWDRIPQNYQNIGIIQPRGSELTFGPTMQAVAAHADQVCLVRGISMDTVAHDVGRRYFITGMVPRGTTAAGSSAGTRIAAQQGDLSAIPHLVSRVESYNENDPAFSSGLVVASPADLAAALTDGEAAPSGDIRAALDKYRAQSKDCDPALLDKTGLLSLIRGSQTKARDLVSSDISQLFNFTAQTPEMNALRQRYGISNANLSGGQAALAFQALKYGVAQNITIELANGLDTHDENWADDHPANLEAGFNALGQLIADLKAENHPSGGKLIDKTTIVVFSEFGRTSLLNNRDGRDHSLTSAALLIGAGVPKGKLVGATTDVGMNPMAIDPQSGAAVTSGGVVLNPTNILASVMKSAGFDTDRLRTDGIPALMG